MRSQKPALHVFADLHFLSIQTPSTTNTAKIYWFPKTQLLTQYAEANKGQRTYYDISVENKKPLNPR